MSEIRELLELDTNHIVRIDDLMIVDQLIALAAGRNFNFEFIVDEKRVVRCGEETNTIFDLRHRDFGLKRLLVVKEYKGLYDLFIYEKPEFFEEKGRADLIQEHPWIFDTETIRPRLIDYPYAPEIHDEFENVYSRIQRDEKGQHQGDGIHTFLIEYKTHPTVDNDRVLFIEVGCLDAANGGWIEFYEGRLIDESNLSV